MANLVKWITDELWPDETVQSFVIGDRGDWDIDEEYDEHIPKGQPLGQLLTWDERHWIDYEFSDGFGGVGCNNINVWTDRRIMFVAQYDGATCLHWVPRFPRNHMPDMPGG